MSSNIFFLILQRTKHDSKQSLMMFFATCFACLLQSLTTQSTKSEWISKMSCTFKRIKDWTFLRRLKINEWSTRLICIFVDRINSKMIISFLEQTFSYLRFNISFIDTFIQMTNQVWIRIYLCIIDIISFFKRTFLKDMNFIKCLLFVWHRFKDFRETSKEKAFQIYKIILLWRISFAERTESRRQMSIRFLHKLWLMKSCLTYNRNSNNQYQRKSQNEQTKWLNFVKSFIKTL